MRVPRFNLGRPQRLAALLLLFFLSECLWVIHRQQLTTTDYRYARCGREMWERPDPLAGYFTTCGNLNGDGTFAYRAAALPLTLQRLVLLGADHLRAPQSRQYSGTSLNGSTWEARHEISSVTWLMHLPFTLFAVWLGAGLWWVARRLFGNEGGFFALGLYCVCPAVVRLSVTPNNEILAMWGLYGLVYTAIGVAHALQGPRSKWRPRILLLATALGLAAAAHLLAAMLGFVAAVILMMYLAEYRRSYVMQILITAAIGALAILFASFSFHLAAFSYVFTGGAGRMWFSLDALKAWLLDPLNLPVTAAAGAALLLVAGVRRCRYFGNLAPLAVFLGLCTVYTTQVVSAPLLWGLPFLFTFIGGVFADMIETRYRKLFLGLSGTILAVQALFCLTALNGLAK